MVLSRRACGLYHRFAGRRHYRTITIRSPHPPLCYNSSTHTPTQFLTYLACPSPSVLIAPIMAMIMIMIIFRIVLMRFMTFIMNKMFTVFMTVMIFIMISTPDYRVCFFTATACVRSISPLRGLPPRPYGMVVRTGCARRGL